MNGEVSTALPAVNASRAVDDEEMPAVRAVPPALAANRPLPGSLPLDVAADGEAAQLVPALLTAPVHLRTAEAAEASVLATDLPAAVGTGNGAGVAGRYALAAADGGGGTVAAAVDSLPGLAQAMLTEPAPAAAGRFLTMREDASFDFDEYVLLRDPDDPSSAGVGPGQDPIPADPRLARFAAAAEVGIAEFIDGARLPLGRPPEHEVLVLALRQLVASWWRKVCAVPAFNRLSRYNGRSVRDRQGVSIERYYGFCLGLWLRSNADAIVRDYLTSGGDSSTLQGLVRVPFWEDCRAAVFDLYFTQIPKVDPTAPTGDYPFEPLPSDEVVFGLRVVHRQTWQLLGYARGDLVRSIPLGPRESRKVSVKVTSRVKMANSSEQATSFESSSESSKSSKDTSDVVKEAADKVNRHVEAEASGGKLNVWNVRVSGGIADETAHSSKDTKTHLNEKMQKTASRMKVDSKVVVSSESEDGFEQTSASELLNPNDEIAVTYLYHRLQQRFWVSAEIDAVESVVLVPEPLPGWDAIDEQWVRDHGEILAGALLDASYAPTLELLRSEPATLSYEPTSVFTDAANAGINAVGAYKGFQGGFMPDLLGSAQQHYERDYERRNELRMSQERRAHRGQALLGHIRRNILHYMRAIWSSEDPDQRLQRYAWMRAPTSWTFVPRSPIPSAGSTSPLEVDGFFVPVTGSARRLSDVIDPIGPVGYLFNCAIWRLREDPRLAGMHQALAYLRAAYTRFAVAVTPSQGAGVTVRQAFAHAPRRFAADYAPVYRTSRKCWLIPVPGLAEADWPVVPITPQGSLDVLGVHVLLDGQPADGATLAIHVRVTDDLQDPHLRLVQLLHPLPATADEPAVFSDALLAEMTTVLPDLAGSDGKPPSWSSVDTAGQQRIREAYHRFLVLRDTGRLVTLDTDNLVLELEPSRSPMLEQFKRLHRYVDVMKEYEEYQRRTLESERRRKLLDKGTLGDPEIERVLVAGTSIPADLVAVVDDLGAVNGPS